MKTTIEVDKETWKTLVNIKMKYELKTLGKTIEYLINLNKGVLNNDKR